MSLLSPGLRLWEGFPMVNTKKMVIAVYGNLYIGNIDTEKLHSQGGFLVTATNEEIQKAIKDIYWLDVRVIRQDIRYENILLGDDVQLCVYATGDIQVGSRMMSTRSVSLSLDYPAFYAIQGSILNAPLNPQEVYELLGIGKYKGEWWDITYICGNNHGRTALWAKYKPFRYPLLSDPTETQRASMRYGINVPMVDPYNIGKDIVWTYSAPRGKDAEPYRIDDFIGYKHNSTPSMEIQIPDKTYLNKQDSNSYVIIAFDEYATSYTDGSLKIVELFSNGNIVSWYPGLLIVHPTKGTIWKTATKKLSEWFPPEDLIIPVRNTWTAGEYVDVYAILSQYSFTGVPTDTPPIEANSMFYLEHAPGAGHKRVLLETYNFIAQYISVTSLNIEFQKNLSGGSYVYEIYYMTGTVKNEYGGNLQFTMSVEISNEETGDVFEYGSKTQLVQGLSSAAFMIDPENAFELPANIPIWEISIRGVQAVGDAGNIFIGRFNFETMEWV